jgi:NTP pyrophosphatase (non-canonical NTP hydrolase)
MNSIDEIKIALQSFAKDRDWDQFHSPKNLSMALAGEAGELLECFQWLTEEQSKNLSEKQLLAVADEIADVQLYLIRLADKLGLNILAECNRKIAINAEKYPVDKSMGKSDKYTNI